MQFREANEADCQNLTSLSLLVWLDTYTLDGINQAYSDFALSTFTQTNFTSLLQTNNYRLVVCTECQSLYAYALINLTSHYQGKDYGYEIERLYVHPKFSGRGIGRSLLNEIGDRFGHKYWLYTWIENQANGFYQHLGFQKIGQYQFELAGNPIKNQVWAFSADAR